jgi:hypothetical protein
MLLPPVTDVPARGSSTVDGLGASPPQIGPLFFSRGGDAARERPNLPGSIPLTRWLRFEQLDLRVLSGHDVFDQSSIGKFHQLDDLSILKSKCIQHV